LKLLLTSGGVSNPSIHAALVGLLDKPIAESSALCIPTAMYGHPNVGPGERVWQFISGQSENPMCELGWKSVGVLELTALPSIDEAQWVPLVRETDVLLASGGDALYLYHWMQQSGLADLLPSLDFSICPHLAQEGMRGNSMAEAEEWAAGIGVPAYAIDDDTAIRVVDGTVDVVSEGHWKLFSS